MLVADQAVAVGRNGRGDRAGVLEKESSLPTGSTMMLTPEAPSFSAKGTFGSSTFWPSFAAR